MKRSKLLEIIREVLSEEGAMGNVTGAIDGGMGSPKVPAVFAKPGQGDNRATKMMKKTFGYKAAPRPEHPSESKMISYLQEEDAGNTEAPFAFTTEEGLYTHNGTKISEKLGMEVIGKPKNSSKKTTENYSDKKNK